MYAKNSICKQIVKYINDCGAARQEIEFKVYVV